MEESFKDMTKENVKSFMRSPIFGSIISKTLIVVGGMAVVVVIFLVGEAVGYHRAEFSSNFGENYNRIFQGSGGMRNQMPLDNLFLNDHGAAGSIVRISLPTLVVNDANGTEKMIMLDDDSSIKEFHNTLSANDLRVGDTITVLGVPQSNGTIKAELIRRIGEQHAVATTTFSQ